MVQFKPINAEFRISAKITELNCPSCNANIMEILKVDDCGVRFTECQYQCMNCGNLFFVYNDGNNGITVTMDSPWYSASGTENADLKKRNLSLRNEITNLNRLIDDPDDKVCDGSGTLLLETTPMQEVIDALEIVALIKEMQEKTWCKLSGGVVTGKYRVELPAESEIGHDSGLLISESRSLLETLRIAQTENWGR